MHPVMPFVTEEIWSLLPGERGLLAAASLPAADAALVDDEAERQVGRLIEAITALRRQRDELDVAPGVQLAARIVASGYEGGGRQPRPPRASRSGRR